MSFGLIKKRTVALSGLARAARSLMSLAKHPSSTVQILGAEKAKRMLGVQGMYGLLPKLAEESLGARYHEGATE